MNGNRPAVPILAFNEVDPSWLDRVGRVRGAQRGRASRAREGQPKRGKSPEVGTVARREDRSVVEGNRRNHAIGQRASPAAARVEQLRREHRVHRGEGRRLANRLGDLFDNQRRDRSAQEFGPCDGGDPDRLTPAQPTPQPPLLDGSRDERPDEEARVQVDHAGLSTPARAAGPSLGTRVACPCGRRRDGEAGSLLGTIQRRECRRFADGAFGRRGCPDDAAQRLGLRDLPSARQAIEGFHGRRIQRIRRLYLGYGHTQENTTILSGRQLGLFE